MRKWLRYTAFGFIAALAGAAASAAFHMFGVSLPADTVDVSYADFFVDNTDRAFSYDYSIGNIRGRCGGHWMVHYGK